MGDGEGNVQEKIEVTFHDFFIADGFWTKHLQLVLHQQSIISLRLQIREKVVKVPVGMRV